MEALSKFMAPGVIFILTLAFGFWLSNTGKPYNGALFNIHKLLALGAVVFTIIRLSGVLKGVHSLAFIIVLLVLAGLCVVAMFASGALMSLGKLDYTLMLTLHRIAPVVLVIALALVFALLGRKL